MLTFAQLVTSLTPDQAKATISSAITALGVNVAGWRKGGVYDTILTYVAQIWSEFTVLAVQAISGAFLDASTGPWLQYLATYVFGIQPSVYSATNATGAVTIVNAGGGVYDFDAGALVFLNTTSNQTYTNDATIHIGAGATLPGVAVTCSVQGSIGNAGPGEVDGFVTPLLGVTVTNPLAIAGSDVMPDATLRLLCAGKLGTLSNGGPRSAYDFAVRTATRPDGTLVNINRVTVSADSSIGVVTIYVASPSGAPDSADVGYAQANVEALARPDGVSATVLAATAVDVASTLTVYARAGNGLLASTVQAEVEAALTAKVAIYPVGGIAIPPSTQGYLFAEYIRSIALGADPNIFTVQDGGAADTPLNAGEVAVLGVTVNVTLVAVP